MNPPALKRLYPLLLSLYPAAFRAEYGEEIRLVYEQALGSKQGLPAWRLVLRELTSLPLVLIRLHWREWSRKGFRSIFVLPDLPTRDGRHSWGLAGLESLFFVVWTYLLVWLTYTDVEWLKAGWYRDMALVSILAALLPLPILLLGLGRGLPRWAYPYFGSLLAYLCYAGWRFHLELVAAVLLLALFVIGAAAAWGNARRPLPQPIQRLGRSLMIDPLRWSFAVYGAVPLLLLFAYDDGFANNQTLFLLLSSLGMLLGALLYTRMHATSSRLAALASGLALATWPALLDRAALAGGVRLGDVPGILGWWVLATALVLVPPVILRVSVLFNRNFVKGS